MDHKAALFFPALCPRPRWTGPGTTRAPRTTHPGRGKGSRGRLRPTALASTRYRHITLSLLAQSFLAELRREVVENERRSVDVAVDLIPLSNEEHVETS